MQLKQELTVRLECRLCGAGFERPVSPGGLCIHCAIMRQLTKRQREVLLAWARPGTNGVPSSIQKFLAAEDVTLSKREQAHGCRLIGLDRALDALERGGMIERERPLRSVRVTRFGRAVARRLEKAAAPACSRGTSRRCGRG